MRFILFGLVLAAAQPVLFQVVAQERDTTRRTAAGIRPALPATVAREVASLFNGARGLRTSGRAEIEAGRTIYGDVAVLRGPLVLGGHVTGRVIAINADVILQPTA